MTKFDKALDYALEQIVNCECRDCIKKSGFMENSLQRSSISSKV